MKFCTHCGAEVHDHAVVCVKCGCPIQPTTNAKTPATGVAGQEQQKMQKSMILGIVGIISAWLLALVGHITSIIGIVIGVKEYKESGKMTGLALSIVGEVCAIISSVIGAMMMGGF